MYARIETNYGDRCRKEIILPILLSNPILFVPNDEAYKSWILGGLDLHVPTDKLRRIKKWAKAKGPGLLPGVVAELIEEWLNEQARMGERALVCDLISALKRNNLRSFGEALESAFQRPVPHSMPAPRLAENRMSKEEEVQQNFNFTPSVNSDCDLDDYQKSASTPSILTTVTSSEDLLKESSFITTEDLALATPSSSMSMPSITTVVKLEQNVATECDNDLSSTKTIAATSVGGAPLFWLISPSSSVFNSKLSSFSYESVNYENEDGSGSGSLNSFEKETEQINERNGVATIASTTTSLNLLNPVGSNTTADVAFLPVLPKVEIASLEDQTYSPPLSFDIFPHSTDLQGSTSKHGELVTDNETQQQKQQQREKEILQKLKNLQETVLKLKQQQSSSRSSHRADKSSRNKRKCDDLDEKGSKPKKRHGSSSHESRSRNGKASASSSGKSRRSRFINEKDRDGLNRLHRAVKGNRIADVIKFIDEGDNVNEPTSEERRRTPLHLAAHCIRDRDDAIEMIKFLIDKGAKPDVTNSRGISFIDGLLIKSFFQPVNPRQFLELVKFLISSGHSKFLTIHSDSFHNGGSSALHLAMKEKILDTDTLLVLQRNEVNLNRPSLAGNSLLFYAIWGGRNIKLIKFLIHNCNVNWWSLNNDGWNVLHMAARHCHEDAFEYFLTRDGSLLKRPNDKRETPLDFVKQYCKGNQRMKKILEKEGVNVKW